jgi:hypothetical protein
MKNQFSSLLAAMIMTTAAVSGFAQGTAFTYQGQLVNNGSAANGTFIMSFTVYTNSSGTGRFAGPIVDNNVGVTNGLFTVILDFGPDVFIGNSNWLSISVGTSMPLTQLNPLQELTPVPYAIFAESASNVVGTVPASQVTGTLLNGQLAYNTIGVLAGTGMTGGGTVALGGSTTIANAGVLSVTGNSDITASASGGAVTLGDTATAAATVNTIVKRDNSGDFSANNISLDGSLILPLNTPAIIQDMAGAIFTVTNDSLFAGWLTGNYSMTGGDNTAVGTQVLFNNTEGFENTGLGQLTLYENTTGYQNTAVGYGALEENTDGSINTAIGIWTLAENTTGSGNTASGYGALDANSNGNWNVAIGENALANNNASQNTAVGAFALADNVIGTCNVAAGYQALTVNNTGSDNVASGWQALLSNTTGACNVADGYLALGGNSSGSNNVASGCQALVNNSTGSDNTASGQAALYANSTGNYNAAFGTSALSQNTTGYDNTACGVSAMQGNVSGNGNLALGYQSLVNNAAGSINVAVGESSLLNLTNGSDNTVLGWEAGDNLFSGTGNIYISSPGVPNENYTLRIGTPPYTSAAYIAGIVGSVAASGTAVYINPSTGQLGTLTSSARYKENIHSMDDASDVLLSLHPVTFRYKPGIDPSGTPQFGLVAEEVNQIDPDLVVRDDKKDIYSVRYEAVNAMLLNEFLKEHRQVESQESEIESLKASNSEMEARLNTLEEMIRREQNRQ